MPRPARPWFRFYSEQLESRKTQDLRRDDPGLYGFWVSFLCIANIQKVRGSLPSVEDIAFALRPDSLDAVRDAVDQLISRHFIDRKGSKLLMHNWEDWQKDSDVRRVGSADEAPLKRGSSAALPPQNYGISRAKRTPRSEEIRDKKRSEGDARDKTPTMEPLDQLCADFAAFGAVGPGTAQAVEWAVRDHGGIERVRWAIKKAAGSPSEDRVPWNYVESILDGDGGPDEPRPNRARANGAAAVPAVADDPDDPSVYRNPRRVVRAPGASSSTPGPDTATDGAGVDRVD